MTHYWRMPDGNIVASENDGNEAPKELFCTEEKPTYTLDALDVPRRCETCIYIEGCYMYKGKYQTGRPCDVWNPFGDPDE